ncbi:neutral/alkaline non-lysosomal ceramidase N-terminal domain-containing protein, partial [Candidatus Bathyarchaeota archaeon]|nr:neutral/alkaline non-lysosomal ceramidase N-terminal domain-containing protein [Candidatus Bathyarchaeota archaeon]
MLEAGASKIKITPPLGVPMDGYLSRTEPSTGIHDHIYARCLVFGDGENYMSLVSLDLLYATRDLTEKVRRTVSNALGLKEDSVAVIAVHNHSGPSVVGFHSAQQYRFLNDYLEVLPNLISSGLIEAFSSKRRVRVNFGRGIVRGWTVNRRKPIIGSVDDEVIAVRFEDLSGRLVSALVNFTCHAVVLGANNLHISGDYPGYVSRTVERIEGGICLFLNGAFGDINPLTPNTDLNRVYERNIGRFEDAIRMGRVIGGEALKILNSALCSENMTFSLSSRKAALKLKPVPTFTTDHIEDLEAKLKVASGKEADEIRLKILTARFLSAISNLFPSGVAEVDVQGFRIGDLIIIVLPGELFVDLGLRIKAHYKFGPTMVVGCANEVLGYIPTEEAVDEGGYEVLPPVCLVEREGG